MEPIVIVLIAVFVLFFVVGNSDCQTYQSCPGRKTWEVPSFCFFWFQLDHTCY